MGRRSEGPGWHREGRRHSLAARGVKTASTKVLFSTRAGRLASSREALMSSKRMYMAIAKDEIAEAALDYKHTYVRPIDVQLGKEAKVIDSEDELRLKISEQANEIYSLLGEDYAIEALTSAYESVDDVRTHDMLRTMMEGIWQRAENKNKD